MALILSFWFAAARTEAADYYVDGTSSACSDSGAGSSSAPYCTIGKAVTARGGAGTTINVAPGTYREMVSIAASGASGNRFIIRAAGSPVVVDGADDYSSNARWSAAFGGAWLASSVIWSPGQVFVDGARLARSASSPSSLPSGSFVFVSGEGLYVNLGGDNPGAHQTFVGRRISGFVMSGRSWVSIQGFTVVRTEDRAVAASNASNDCELTGLTVSLAGSYGIQVSGSARALVENNTVSNCADHGIAITAGSSAGTIQDNESFGNARPSVKAANGINLSGATANLVQRNRLHDNQDTGLQCSSSANNNLMIQNRSWNNGDHGFDHYASSSGNTHIGDVSYHNFKDGFSIEGNSPNTSLINCISVDNGLTTGEFDLWIDSASSSGFTSNSNIFWNSVSSVPPIKYVDATYTTISAYSARSGQDSRSIIANPKFDDAPDGDFHLLSGSPAIDSGDASVANWPVTDADGLARFDDPATSNSGIGPPVTYADRGALEFNGGGAPPPNQPPNGTIDSPSGSASIVAGQSVSFSGTGLDPDGNIPLVFSWDFGGGAASRTVEDPGAVTFATAGTYTVTFTVTDSLGLSDATPDSRVITVSPQSGGGGTSLDRRVTSSSDDAEERSGSTSLSSSDLELTFDGQTQVIGIRFTSLAIPQGATITAAWIQFTAKETQSETTALTIHGQAADDAATFTSSALNVSSRPRTTSSVSWAPVAWSSIGQAGPNQRTPDLAPILREITGRTGWASGRALAFIITGTGHRTPYAYDGSSSSAPLLHVEFTTGGGSPNQAPNGTIDTPTSDVSITAGQSVSFSATGTDPDGNTPLSFAWDFGGGAANSTLEDPGSVTFSTPGTYTVRLTVKDSLALADPTPATRVITVATISGGTGGQNLVGNPSFEVNTNGWSAYGSATITRVAGGQDGAFCLEMRGPSSTSEFGLNDTPSWVTNTGAAGTTFRISAFVRSNAAHGTAKIRIREYLNGTQTGSTIYSAGVPLSAAWQILSRDYVTTRAGSSIDVQILDYPVASGEIFQTDTVSIQTVP